MELFLLYDIRDIVVNSNNSSNEWKMELFSLVLRIGIKLFFASFEYIFLEFIGC